MAPNLATAAGGVWLTWLEEDGEPEGGGRGRRTLRWASLEGGSWSAPGEIVSGVGFFANWADLPSMTRASDGVLYSHWLQMAGPGSYDYDIRLARSRDDGSTWEPMGTLHHDGVLAEHGFVTLLPEGGGVRAFWLDGREMSPEGKDGDPGTMTLRTALVDEEAGPDETLDDRVCECCQTAAVMTPGGPQVFYRNRSEGEIRDIYTVRGTSTGWSAPRAVHDDGWEVPGCPVNGPAADAAGERVALAWFTAAGNLPRVLAALSRDGGATFSPPVEIDGQVPVGRVDVVLDPRGGAVVSWLAASGENAVVRLRRLEDDGRAGPPVDVADASRARSTGFPRMALAGDDLIVVWTDAGEQPRVRGAAVPLSSLPRGGDDAAQGAGGGVEEPRAWDRRPGSMFPAFAAPNLDGEMVSLAGLQGDAVLVNLWATWCKPCREELPELIHLHERHGPEGLKIVGVSVDMADAKAEVRRFVETERIPYLILHDEEGDALALFGVSSLPGSFLFDRRGVLVWSKFGLLEPGDPELAAAMARALQPGARAAGFPPEPPPRVP